MAIPMATRKTTQTHGIGMSNTSSVQIEAIAARAEKARMWPTRLISEPERKVPIANPRK